MHCHSSQSACTRAPPGPQLQGHSVQAWSPSSQGHQLSHSHEDILATELNEPTAAVFSTFLMFYFMYMRHWMSGFSFLTRNRCERMTVTWFTRDKLMLPKLNFSLLSSCQRYLFLFLVFWSRHLSVARLVLIWKLRRCCLFSW